MELTVTSTWSTCWTCELCF